MMSAEDYVIVAAIDFGTTFSGYAFSFINDKDKIFVNKNWGENLGCQSYKTPTCVMVDSANNFHAFGYEAEEKYTQLENKDDYQLYRHFKMMLQSVQKLTKESTIPSIDGKMTSALEIFAMALRYLKKHLIEGVSKQTKGPRVTAELIRWVITVPAIWSETAKQFMREAAFRAGIIKTTNSQRLLIALEPEAASVFCRSLDVNQFIATSAGKSQPSFRAGTKYLVIDAGGGTVDLTAHEVLSSGRVKEIITASGGPWGGTKVDDNFVKLLEDVLGSHFVSSFQKQCPQQWLKFMLHFEILKHSVKPDGACKLNISIPMVMEKICNKICGKGIDKAIEEAKKPGVSFCNGSIVLKYEVIVALFQPVIEEIVSHIEELLEKPDMSACSYFMLVGGFAASALLQKAIIDKFEPYVNVLVPGEAQMSVIKGAVMFGHRPKDIEVRKARYTYGAECMRNYNPAIDDGKYMALIEGKEIYTKLFSIFVRKGSDVKVGDTVSHTYTPHKHGQTEANVSLFQSDNADVKYVVEAGCRQVGKLHVEMPNAEKDMDRKVEIAMIFGGTEIQVVGFDEESKRRADATIDFFCD